MCLYSICANLFISRTSRSFTVLHPDLELASLTSGSSHPGNISNAMHGTYFLHACLAILAALGCHGVQAGRRPRGVCFRNEREAASIASLHLANLQRDIQRTECDSEKIFEVYKNYVSDNVTFTANGQVRTYTNA